MELLVSIKSVASMITRMPAFNPSEATGPTIEILSLMGRLCRLGVFGQEWVRKSSSSGFPSIH
jgi:ubiquitin conjugation factor E4 B